MRCMHRTLDMTDQIRANDLVEVINDADLRGLVDKRYDAPGADDEVVIPPLTATVEKVLTHTYTLRGGDKRYAYFDGSRFAYYDANYKERALAGGTLSAITNYDRYGAVVNVAEMNTKTLQFTLAVKSRPSLVKEYLDQAIRLIRRTMKKMVPSIAVHSITLGERGPEQQQDVLVSYTIPINSRSGDETGALSSDTVLLIVDAVRPRLSAIGISIDEAIY